jgi:CheY-like chemotaxis protein
VELHGGQIVARSEGREHGAELEVRLPIVAAPPREAALERSRANAPCRILVVEDNGDAAQMLHDLLEVEGHSVRIAETGTRAHACLKDWSVDLVLCDLGLPGMSGLDLARIIRADEALCHIPLVALTGYGQAEDRTQSAEAGFHEHLVKPVDLEVLDGVIGRLVRKG